jgi:hypothetical protein
MNVREEDAAGAVLLYDAEGPDPSRLTEALFVASVEQNDALGAALALPRIAGRQIVAAGAPGAGEVALFYCPDLLTSGLGGARCQ